MCCNPLFSMKLPDRLGIFCWAAAAAFCAWLLADDPAGSDRLLSTSVAEAAADAVLLLEVVFLDFLDTDTVFPAGTTAAVLALA
jgi:hypothetical protein